MHNKLLDRFTTNEDLMAYIQTPAGRRFLESAPLSVEGPPRRSVRRFSRILWSLQVGIVLAAGALGLLFVSGRVIEEVAQPLFAVGVLALTVGAGFVVSAAASLLLSRRLGLFEPWRRRASTPIRRRTSPVEHQMFRTGAPDVTLTDIERLEGQRRRGRGFEMDEEAFRAFYDRTARALWVYLSRMTGDSQVADDLLQESYYRLLRSRRHVGKRKPPPRLPLPDRHESRARRPPARPSRADGALCPIAITRACRARRRPCRSDGAAHRSPARDEPAQAARAGAAVAGLRARATRTPRSPKRSASRPAA